MKYRLYLFLLLLTGASLYSAPVRVQNGTIILDCAKKRWGKPKRMTLIADPGKTPDGEKSVGFEFTPGPVVHVYSDSAEFKKIWSKLDFPWSSCSFWVWSDGSEMPVTLTFYSRDARGKAGILHVHTFRLIHKGWKLMTFKGMWCNKNGIGPMRFKTLDHFSFYADPKREGKFYLGPLRFKIKDHLELTSFPVTEATPVTKAPEIDGIADDVCWKSLNHISLVEQNKTKKKNPVPQVRIGYDKENVYVLFSQKIDTKKLVTKQKDHTGTVWSDDSFQIFFSPRNDNRTRHQYIVNALNVRQSYHQYYDKVALSHVFRRDLNRDQWRTAVKVYPDKWVAECAIKRTAADISDGDLHGLQIFVNNPSTNTTFWFSPAEWAIDTSLYGAIRFSGRKGQAKPIKKPLISLNYQELRIQSDAGKFRFQMATPDGQVYTAEKEFNGFAADEKFFRKSGAQRLVLWNDDSVFAGKTKPYSFAIRSKYGERILVPNPKKLTFSKNIFRPSNGLKIRYNPAGEQAAKKLGEELASFLRISPVLEKDPSLAKNRIVAGENIALPAPAEKSGYALSITSGGIVLQGNDSAGLHYSVITLGQLLRYAFLRNETFLPGCSISDWPDLPYRIFHLWANACYNQYDEYQKGLYSKTADTPEEKVKALFEYSERFIFGLKKNFYRFQAPDILRYEWKKNKKYNHKYTWMTMTQLKEFAGFVQKNHCEFVPQVAGSSHADYMLTRADKSLVMDGYCDWNADPTHPKFFPYLFGYIDEISAAAPSRYFCTSEDEWFHNPTKKIEIAKNGKLWRDIFYETILKEYDHLKKKGARLVMESDMLQRYHNGGKPFDNYKNLDRLPKDIILSSWYGGEDGIKELAGKGFTTMAVYPSAIGYFNPDRLRSVKNFKGTGTIISGGWGGTYSGGLQRVVASGEYAWNFFTMKPVSLDDYMFANGNNIMAMLSVKPNPAASGRFIPVDLTVHCNANSLPGQIPHGKKKIGFIPMTLPKGKMIRGGEKETAIQVNRKAASLIFLHTQLLENTKTIYKCSPRVNGWENGNRTGYYLVRYANGKEVRVVLRDTINCGYYAMYAGTKAYQKYGADVRYVWESPDRKNYLYQFEWINPHPELQIKSISLHHMKKTNPHTVPCLIALTLRDVKR